MTPHLFEGTGLEPLPSFLTSLAIGLLIGLERERSPPPKPACAPSRWSRCSARWQPCCPNARIRPGCSAVGLLVIGAMIIAAYARGQARGQRPGHHHGIAATLICYGLARWSGSVSAARRDAGDRHHHPALFQDRAARHHATISTRRDLVSILQFAVLTFIVLPILPDQNYGPYDAFNPHQSVADGGADLRREPGRLRRLALVGERYGTPLLGLFGGLVSSTATTLVYARNGRAQQRHDATSPSSSSCSPTWCVLVRLATLTAIVSLPVLPVLLPVLGSGLLLGLAGTLYHWRHARRRRQPADAGNHQPDRDPHRAELRRASTVRSCCSRPGCPTSPARPASTRWRWSPA